MSFLKRITEDLFNKFSVWYELDFNKNRPSIEDTGEWEKHLESAKHDMLLAQNGLISYPEGLSLIPPITVYSTSWSTQTPEEMFPKATNEYFLAKAILNKDKDPKWKAREQAKSAVLRFYQIKQNLVDNVMAWLWADGPCIPVLWRMYKSKWIKWILNYIIR